VLGDILIIISKIYYHANRLQGINSAVEYC